DTRDTFRHHHLKAGRLNRLSIFHSNLAHLPPLEILLIMIVEHYVALRFEYCWVHQLIEALTSLKPYQMLYVKDASDNWKMVGTDVGNKLFLKEPSANVILLDYISSES
ncbi:hypothetical protein HID58_070329, partial [Brassica napus]